MAEDGEPVADGRVAGAGRPAAAVSPRMARRHAIQRAVSIVMGPVWVTVTVVGMYFGYRYRIADVARVRREYRRLRAESDAPLLVCANHLTLVDSFLIAWALGSAGYWLWHPDELPWNTPERAVAHVLGQRTDGDWDVVDRVEVLHP